MEFVSKFFWYYVFIKCICFGLLVAYHMIFVRPFNTKGPLALGLVFLMIAFMLFMKPFVFRKREE